MQSSSPHPIKQTSPITIHEAHSTTPYIRKYAPKFINLLKIYDKQKLPLRIRYMKKVLSLNCHPKSWSQNQEEWKHILFKVAKRFRKFCRGTENLDQKFLSSFLSVEECRLSNVFELPLYLKTGRFTKLTLGFQDSKEPQLPQKISKIVRNIKRSKFLKNLDIAFVRFAHKIPRLFLLELQKYPQIISSLDSFRFHYRSPRRDRDNDAGTFSESFFDLKPVLQSVTRLSLNIETYQKVNLNLEDFRELNSLNLTLRSPHETDFVKLISFGALANLESLILKTPLDTQEAVENLFKSFRPPKSIKKLGLSRMEDDLRDFLPLTQFLKETNLEEWSPSKEFFERWREFDQLSDLTLTFEGTPESSDIDFLFMTPILQRCQGLKRLKIITACYFCENLTEHSGHLQWAHILQALEPFKETLESFEIDACKIGFDENITSNFAFKNLKDLYIRIRRMEAKGFAHVSSIVPKTIQKYHLFYDIILHNEQDIQELFNYLQFIPKRFWLTLYLFFPKINPETFEKSLLQYLSSAKIEGYLLICIQDLRILHPEGLRDSIESALNIDWTGYLEIVLRRFGTLWRREKSNILYSLEHQL